MVDKITLTNLVNLTNQTTAVNAINSNNAILTTAMDNTLSRDGTQPNTMSATLDMNSNRIINLPSATSTTEPITLSQFNSMIASTQVPNGLVSVGVPVSAAMQPIVNSSTLVAAGIQLTPQMFGALGNGVADDTTALQNWINAIQSTKNPGLFTAGVYNISSTLNITAACTIKGAGSNLAAAIIPSPSITALSINTTQTVHLESFTIQYNSPALTGTVGLSKTSPIGTQSLYDRFINIVIFNAFTAMAIDRCVSYVIDQMLINTTGANAIIIANTFNVDNGDGCVTNCTFVAIGADAILYTSGGGLKVSNIKVSTAGQGVVLDISSGVVSGDLLVTNSSFEGITGSSILLERQTNSGSWINVLVNNCEFESNYGIVVSTDTSSWLSNLTASNNIWVGTSIANSTMYSIDSTINISIIGGTATAGGGTTPRKFIIGSGVSTGVIGAISGSGFTSSINSGTGVTTIAPF